jgi:hypothetical protein
MIEVVHESLDSLQPSVVQLRPSSHIRPGETQVPEPLQASSPLQYRPSLHAKPAGRFDHEVELVAALQTWHGFPGLGAPSVQQAPPTKQLPALTALLQASIASLQESVVQERLSSQLRPGEVQLALALQVSSPLHQAPSGQAYPAGRLDHMVVLDAASQNWHGLAGLATPFA